MTLTKAQTACSYDKTCTGILQEFGDVMFNMCYGGIYLPRGEKQDDEDGDGNVYKKEILYGKQYDY